VCFITSQYAIVGVGKTSIFSCKWLRLMFCQVLRNYIQFIVVFENILNIKCIIGLFSRVPSHPARRPRASLCSRGLGSPARSSYNPTLPPLPAAAKMATNGTPRLSMPLLLPVTSLLLSLLLTCSNALCKYQDATLRYNCKHFKLMPHRG